MRRWLALLLAAAAVLLAFTCVEAARGPAGARGPVGDFHRLTGGLGMGATAALYWDFSTFDPRLEPDCTCSIWPVPGGFLYSPEHGSTAWDPPECLWHEVTPEPTRDGRGR